MGIFLYFVGTLTGGALIYLHYRAINYEREKYQNELRRLEEKCRQKDCAEAYRRGFQKGRFSPATDAEQFAKTFEGRRVEFKEMK